MSKRSLAELNFSKRTIDNKQFKKMIKSWGATLVGFGDVTEGLAWEFKYLPRAISLAVAHPSPKESVVKKNSLIAYTNQFPAIDACLENMQKRVTSYLRSLGWKAFAIPPDTDKRDPTFAARLFPLFPHKTAATCSGLGWVGKNGLLVTKEYGARLSWATVLTDAPLEVSGQPCYRGDCNECRCCVDACPAGAIRGIQWSRENSAEPLIDTQKCAQQLAYHGQVFGKMICAHCIVVCPLGKERRLGKTKKSKAISLEYKESRISERVLFKKGRRNE